MCCLASCDDTTETLGSSLTNTADVISVSDGVYDVASRSVAAGSVLSRNTLGYLGKVKDPETGAYIKSDFITQLNVLESASFVDQSYLPNGVVADSCDLRVSYDKFFGDSLTSMKATIYELKKPIEEGTTYYSSFDPIKEGLVRIGEGAVKSSRTYSLVNTNFSDSVRNAGHYTNNICFSLNDPYTSVDGITYKNYGTYIMQKFYDDPSNFKNSYNFTHNICPGFYIKMDNGIGAMAYINNTRMNVYYTYKDSTLHNSGQSFGGTEEIKQITEITNDNDKINDLIADNTCTYIKAPAGIYTELTLPVEEICNGHQNDSINAAKIVLNCYNKNNDFGYVFSAPKTILMIPADSLETFFENKEVINYKTSYIASYASSTNNYTFSNIGQLVKRMYSQLPEGAAQAESWKKQHPNWNKVLLVPVTANYTVFENAYGKENILNSLTHDMSLSSVRLVGGSGSTNGTIKVSVIYTKFN